MDITYIYNRRYRWRIVLMAIMLLLAFMPIYVRPIYANGSVRTNSITQPPVTFFSGSQDIPVMPGLVELDGRSFSYDKPEGEIIEIVARMDGVNTEQVLFYYEAILPQFGWGKVNAVFDGANFYREEAYLDISFDSEGAQSFVKIMIHPIQ